ncbi:hypothetical protein [Hyalangium sp.]|uniref:hypothetical protein n=1 Tax=Hyalangium sp. TaxID=2028555 RepID=UPI002D5500D0|nr:hypothetical protein [Hyalangium sp.]HYH98223.1 hypothetical protein [Hyalangium sp.]
MLVPRFEYLVDDLTAEREEVLRARPGPPLVRMAWLLLRSGRSEKLATLLEGWRPLLAEVLASPEGHEHLRAIVHYLLRVGVEAAHAPLRHVLNSVAGEQRAEELMKTMGDALIEQGHAKGLAEGLAEGVAKGRTEGLAEGRAEGVLRILAARGIAVDETARKLILSCTDLNTLDQWLDRALSATSLSDLMMNG